jgi:hypothetical protein
MPLSTIFQLHCGSLFYWWMKTEYLEKTTDLPVQNFNVVTCEFSFCYKILSSDFLQSSNIYKLYEKIICAKFIVLSVSFTRPITI